MENKNMKPKILFVLTRSPYPAVDGTRERILGELKALKSDFQINLLIITDEIISTSDKNTLQYEIDGEVFIFKLTKIGCYFHSFINLLSHNPLQSGYFYSRKANNWLKINGHTYKSIHFHTLRFGRYISYLKKYKNCPESRLLLCFNDAISLNYKDAQIKAKGLWRLIYKIETNRIKNYELKMLKIADDFSIVSERDKQYIESNWKMKYKNQIIPIIQVIRSGIEDAIFNFNYKPQTNNFVFIGNLFYPPNRQGLSFFCNNIWPEILKRKPETKFLIIGRGGEEFFNNIPKVEILGFVDKPYQLMTEQALFISPAVFGAGVPTKSLLAMALGLPVISTIINAAGIEGVIDGQNICLIDYTKPQLAVNKIINILEDEKYRKNIGSAGKELVFQKYRQSVNYFQLRSFISGSN